MHRIIIVPHTTKNIKKLNMDINESKFTYDGIDVCGERAAIQVRI